MTPEAVVSTAVLARLFDLSEARVRELTRAGKIPAAGRGRYALAAAIPAYCRTLRDAAAGRGGDGPLDLAQERAALAVRQRERIELDLAARRGELVEAAQVERDAYRVARVTRDRLLNVPDRIAAEVAAETDPARVHRTIANEIATALRELTQILTAPPPGGATPDEDPDAH